MLSDPHNCYVDASSWSVDPTRISVVIPVLNASSHLASLLPALAEQGLDPAQYLVIDSASTDDSVAVFRAFGATVVGIERLAFNHGGTRQYAVKLRPDADIVVMLTQDAIPQTHDAIMRLVAAFRDSAVGMAYGRQLPRKAARGIERHARLTNYPPQSEIRSIADQKRLGVKTVFCSDSFAAYRLEALSAVGGFPEDTFFAEDQIVAGKMLIEGWKIAYCGDATVIHSHGYTLIEEFRRYFDVGIFHGRNRWLIDTFGKAEGEGIRFIQSEITYLMRHDRGQLPSAVIRTFAKYIGYKMGNMEKNLSSGIKRKISMQPFYWK